jgi:hypothetical protein
MPAGFRKLQFSTASILIVTLIASVFFAFEFYEARAIAKLNANMDQSIAGSMIINFLKDNGDQWPTGWEDLEPYFLAVSKSANKEEAWNSYKKRVSIDFSINTEDLRARCIAGDKDLLVVQTKLDPRGHEKRMNPYLRIYHYLSESKDKPSLPKSTTIK